MEPPERKPPRTLQRSQSSLEAARHYDSAYGAVLGVLVGDAAAAVVDMVSDGTGLVWTKPLEARQSDSSSGGEALAAAAAAALSTTPSVAAAMRMSGGGALRVGKGQITDVGEVVLCLAQTLAGQKPEGGFTPALLEKLASMYMSWMESSPFVCSDELRSAFSLPANIRGTFTVAANMTRAAAEKNAGHKAAGGLPRAAALAAWAHRTSDKNMLGIVRADSALTHPNRSCADAADLYAVAVCHLIRNKGDAVGALDTCEHHAVNNSTADVREWLVRDSAGDLATGFDCRSPETATHVKWGFILAFHHLRKYSAFDAALSDVLKRGGDVRANAAAVGGLLGALHGASAIPGFMKDPVLAFKPGGKMEPGAGHPRPEFLRAGAITELLPRLYDPKLVAATPAALRGDGRGSMPNLRGASVAVIGAVGNASLGRPGGQSMAGQTMAESIALLNLHS